MALALLMSAIAGVAQMTVSAPEMSSPAPHHDQRHSTLLARSDMQQPKPIPIINPLRYAEIPVAQTAPEVHYRGGENVERYVVVSAPESGNPSISSESPHMN